MTFYMKPSLCALLRNNKQHVVLVLGKRGSVNTWKKADFGGFREKDE
jgi:hypothetical protein